MSRVARSRGLLLAACCALCAVPFHAGCRKDARSTEASRPLATLTQDDLRTAVESLEFSSVSATRSASGQHENVTVVGLKTVNTGDAVGTKPVRLVVSLHEGPNERPAGEQRLEEAGSVFRREGRHILSVELSNHDHEEERRILDRLLAGAR